MLAEIPNIYYICLMKARIEDKGKIGIYCIYNKVNNKVYIGKSTNIYRRIVSHISCLNKKKLKGDNQYFINSWYKYGINNFDYKVLQYFDKFNEKTLMDAEAYWMIFNKSTNSKFGYNLRFDSSTLCTISKSTRIKQSLRLKKRFSNKNERDKISIQMRKFWKDNPDIKK